MTPIDNDAERGRELDRDSCWELLQLADVGRVVYSDHALPAVVPVNYLLDGGDVVIRTSTSSRLARVVGNGTVLAFEVDDVEPALESGWSVVVTGGAHIEDDPERRARVLDRLTPWMGGERELLIRIPATVVTGRRIVPHPRAAVGGAPR